MVTASGQLRSFLLESQRKKEEGKKENPTTLLCSSPQATRKALNTTLQLRFQGRDIFPTFGRDTPSRVTLFLLLNLGRGPSRTAAAAAEKKKKKKKKGRHIPGHPGDLRPQLCPCGDLARCHPDVGRGARAEMTKRLAAGRTLPRGNFHHRAHYTHTNTHAQLSSEMHQLLVGKVSSRRLVVCDTSAITTTC